MAKVEDCPGFETFGADVKAAREAKRLARKTLAEMVGIEWRYLANIENQGAIPSLPVMIQLIKVCGLRTLTRRSCGRKANSGNGSATS